MRYFSSGLRANQLGLAARPIISGTLPSGGEKTYVLHGKQNLERLTRILNKDATPADLEAALAIAAQNDHLDQFVKEAINYGREDGVRRQRRRLAGESLLVGLGTGGLVLLADNDQGPSESELVQPLIVE
jgi:hypothetical protein